MKYLTADTGIFLTLIHKFQLRCYSLHTESRSLVRLLKQTLNNLVVSGTQFIEETLLSPSLTKHLISISLPRKVLTYFVF